MGETSPALTDSRFTSDLREIFDQIPLGCFVLNGRQRILEVNHSAARLLKMERQMLLGRYLNRYLSFRHRETLQNFLTTVVEEPKILEMEFLDWHGGRVPVEVRIVRMGQSHEINYLLTVSDVSERRRADDRLRAQQAELARAYRFLTLEEMARGLAHEINQPLTAILNYANSGLRKIHHDASLSTDLTKNLLEQIGTQVQRAADVIRRLRALLQRTPGRESCSVNFLVTEAVKLTQTEIRTSHARIRLLLGGNLPEVEVDQLQFIQALVNLILYSLESMTRNPGITPRLIIATYRDSTEPVNIAFHDNGPGTLEEVTALMNNPLFSKEYSSIRMGLPVTRAIIEGHGGCLWATSNRLRGITMRLALPCI